VLLSHLYGEFDLDSLSFSGILFRGFSLQTGTENSVLGSGKFFFSL